MFKNLKSLVSLLKEATGTISENASEGVETTEEAVKTAFEKYFAKNEKFKQEISKSIEGALDYLK